MSNNLLEHKKVRQTPFRAKVIELFQVKETALSMQEIELALGDHDRITLYRTIKTFLEKGVIHEITMNGQDKKLALCDISCSDEGHAHEHNHEHLHFHCRKCNELFCVDVDSIPMPKADGFQIEQLEIQAVGVCKSCG